MPIQEVKQYFKSVGLENRIIELSESSATVELAAQALNCEPERIAKSLSFLVNEKPIIIVMAGDTKVDNRKFREEFHDKAKMISSEYVEGYIGHAPGGVCPFAVNENVTIYLDESLKRFSTVFPAAGNAHSAIELNLKELNQYANAQKWVDVCKGWNGN